MRIRQNLAVLRHDRTRQYAGRRNQQLVGWIAVEGWRQLSGLYYDLRAEREKRNAGLCQSVFYPKLDGPIEFQPLILY